MKLERLLGIVMILVNQNHVTAKTLADRFSVSIRTIQRDIEILSVTGIPIVASTGPNGGYSLLDNYKIDRTFLKKEELRLLTDLLNGLEKILNSTNIRYLSDKINAMKEEEVGFRGQHIRFDFMPWLPNHSVKEKIVKLSESIGNSETVEIVYRDQHDNKTLRRVEPYELLVKEYSWYVYGFCLERNDFRMFKVYRIDSIRSFGEYFIPREYVIEDPFKGLKEKLVKIKLKFNLAAIGRLDDYFSLEDIHYFEDLVVVETLYPDDAWLDHIILSFGKDAEVLEPMHIRDRIKKQLYETYIKYK